MTAKSVYITNDISIAAFLLFKGMTLMDASSGTSKYSFSFADPDNLGQKYILEFPNTDLSKYDSYLRMLRSIIKK